MIITKGIVTMTTAGLHETSSLNSKFFGVCSKFLDIPLFKLNLFIKDDLRARGCHFTVKPAQASHTQVPVGAKALGG